VFKVVTFVVGNNYEINKIHARIFARAIYKDIASYIQSHQADYEKFKEVDKNDDYQSPNGRNGDSV